MKRLPFEHFWFLSFPFGIHEHTNEPFPRKFKGVGEVVDPDLNNILNPRRAREILAPRIGEPDRPEKVPCFGGGLEQEDVWSLGV